MTVRCVAACANAVAVETKGQARLSKPTFAARGSHAHARRPTSQPPETGLWSKVSKEERLALGCCILNPPDDEWLSRRCGRICVPMGVVAIFLRVKMKANAVRRDWRSAGSCVKTQAADACLVIALRSCDTAAGWGSWTVGRVPQVRFDEMNF